MYVKIAVLCLLWPLAGVCADDFDQLRQQADAARTAHDATAAIPLYEKALRLNAEWPEGWWYLGNLYYGQDRFVDSQEAFRRLTILAPDVGESWGMEGLAAMRAGAYAEALTWIDKSLSLKFELNPGIRDTIVTNRAFLLTRLGRFDDALAVLAGFIHAGPDPALLNALGIAALRRKWLPTEVPESDKDLVSNAGRVEFAALTNDGNAGELAAALKTRFPKAAGVHYLDGFIMFPHDPHSAEAEFRDELAIEPTNPAASSMLAYSIFVDHGDLASAEALAKHATDMDASNAGYEYVLGRILDARGAHDAAVAALEIATKMNPADVENHIALAAACAAAGRSQEAAEERQRALQLKFAHAG